MELGPKLKQFSIPSFLKSKNEHIIFIFKRQNNTVSFPIVNAVCKYIYIYIYIYFFFKVTFYT